MENYFADCMNEGQLKARYRELCVRMHPDKNSDDPEATAKFQEMQQQYEERRAELNGDYTASRKGRERREREAREREERERRERERRKVEMVVEQARLNRQKSFREYKAGDYVYACQVNETLVTLDWDYMSVDDLLHVTLKEGVKDERVVKIETVVDMHDDAFMEYILSNSIPGGVWGGWEIIQTADPASGIKKSKRVAKVVMFRDRDRYVFGNPMGDRVITDYYMPVDYKGLFALRLHNILEQMQREEEEKRRIEAEKKAKLLAEQQPMIDEWKDRLIELSHALTVSETQKVAAENLKTVLKGKFPGTTFKLTASKYSYINYHLSWEDGPMMDEVDKVVSLFECKACDEKTPWQEKFGRLVISDTDRKMSVLTKAKILQQLGQVTEAFRECGIDDEVELTDFDWLMLHAMVGVDVNSQDVSKCMNTLHADGRRTVRAMSAVLYIFKHTSYKKQTKTAKKKAA